RLMPQNTTNTGAEDMQPDLRSRRGITCPLPATLGYLASTKPGHHTPPEIVELCRRVLGTIDLDPASCEVAQRTVRATRYFTAETDGFKQEWHGKVFLNFPYHKKLGPLFVNKLLHELRAGHTSKATMVVNNSTDTNWFDAAAERCTAICFVKGRVKFIK